MPHLPFLPCRACHSCCLCLRRPLGADVPMRRCNPGKLHPWTHLTSRLRASIVPPCPSSSCCSAASTQTCKPSPQCCAGVSRRGGAACAELQALLPWFVQPPCCPCCPRPAPHRSPLHLAPLLGLHGVCHQRLQRPRWVGVPQQHPPALQRVGGPGALGARAWGGRCEGHSFALEWLSRGQAAAQLAALIRSGPAVPAWLPASAPQLLMGCRPPVRLPLQILTQLGFSGKHLWEGFVGLLGLAVS